MFKSELCLAVLCPCILELWKNQRARVAAHKLSSQKSLRGPPASGRRLFNLPCDNKDEAEGQIAAPADPPS